MPSSPGPVGSTRMAFRMTIGLPRPWPGYPHHTGLISASCTSNPRFRHRLSSDPALRRTPLPRRMVPVITVHRGLPPPECTSLLDTPGETACPTLLDQSFGEVGGAGGFACRWKLISIAHPNPENGYALDRLISGARAAELRTAQAKLQHSASDQLSAEFSSKSGHT